MTPTSIAAGILAVLLAVGGMVWLAKRGHLEPEDTNHDSPAERDDLATNREDFRVSVRDRLGAWSGPYKLFVAGIVGVGLSMAAITYYVLKTGSPVESYFPPWVYSVAVGLAGVAGGVRLKAWFDDQIGELTILYERANGPPVAETVRFAKHRVRRAESGTPKVPEVADRLLGLFPRYRLVGEDRQLRGSQKPLGDIVEHMIPPHGVETPNGGFVVPTHKDGQRPMRGATAVADYEYASTNSISDERAQEIQAEKEQVEVQNQTLQALNAQLNKELKTMRKKLENEDYATRDDLLADFERFSEMYSTLNVKIDDQTNGQKNGAGEAAESEEVGA